jgi:GT2 family glycosyltransferase
MSSLPSATAVRILAVIVLYQSTPARSRSLESLQEAFARLSPGLVDLQILLYDNTPGGQDPGPLPAGIDYKADIQNSGLAAAYNYALELAHQGGFEWLLTLDQDTSLPADFLVKLCPAAAYAASLDSVAAIVPCLFGGGRAMSPWIRKWYWIRPTRIPEGFIGVAQGRVFAANSASTLRVSALQAIGGYDPRFYLWASDLVLYSCLHKSGFRIFVAGHIHVEHEASILDLKHRSTPQRYEDMLRADEAFFDEFTGRADRAVWLLMTLHRLVFRIWTTGGGFAHFKIALRFLCRGLFCSRRRRMASWRRFVERRCPASQAVPDSCLLIP